MFLLIQSALMNPASDAASSSKAEKIGLALGSGASRGWSHIGVLQALRTEKIEPEVVCGTSVGAMIGAAYLSGRLDALEEWVLGSSRLDVYRFLEIQVRQAGFVDTERFKEFLHKYVADDDSRIEDFNCLYAAVATDVNSGREIWLAKGNVCDAVRASMAMPGLFPTVRLEDQWLVDGGLVNPVPVSTCRALGADFVIAVNLNANLLGKRVRMRAEAIEQPAEPRNFIERVKASAVDYSQSLFVTDPREPPGLFEVIANSINIFQDRITRSRLAGDPADVLITPKLAHIGLLDFHRAAEAIAEGRERTRRAIEDIRSARTA